MDEVRPTVMTRMFIDLWNIVTFERLFGPFKLRFDERATSDARVPFEKFPFSLLAEKARALIGVVDYEVCYAYCLVPKKPPSGNERLEFNSKLRFLEDSLRYQLRVNTELTTYPQKDVDALMVNKLWNVALEIINEGIARREIRKRVLNIVLVSGDGIFMKVLSTMQERLVDYLDIRLYVFAWKGHASQIYEAALLKGSIEECIMLDDFIGGVGFNADDLKNETTAV